MADLPCPFGSILLVPCVSHAKVPPLSHHPPYLSQKKHKIFSTHHPAPKTAGDLPLNSLHRCFGTSTTAWNFDAGKCGCCRSYSEPCSHPCAGCSMFPSHPGETRRLFKGGWTQPMDPPAKFAICQRGVAFLVFFQKYCMLKHAHSFPFFPISPYFPFYFEGQVHRANTTNCSYQHTSQIFFLWMGARGLAQIWLAGACTEQAIFEAP